MFRPRVIPCLLLKNQGLVKTRKFKDPKYLGDPINIVRIFNDKEVDEIVFLDITATIEGKEPPYALLEDIVSEAFMPFGYGGGIRRLDQIKRILGLGVEKVVINTHAVDDPAFISEAAQMVGAQSIVASIDVKKTFWGKHEVYIKSGRKSTGLNPVGFAALMEKMGAGELIINSIDCDGTMKGYDLDLIKSITSAVSIPVVTSGGAGDVKDLADAVIHGGASAAGAGSLFVFHGPHRAVLISYPSNEELKKAFGE